MYTLYYKRSENTIKVSKVRKAFHNLDFTEEVTRYNDCYFICSKRKPLVELAKKIKSDWILDLENALNKIKNIKV